MIEYKRLKRIKCNCRTCKNSRIYSNGSIQCLIYNSFNNEKSFCKWYVKANKPIKAKEHKFRKTYNKKIYKENMLNIEESRNKSRYIKERVKPGQRQVLQINDIINININCSSNSSNKEKD